MPVAELDSADNIKVLYGPGYIVKGDTTYRVITNHLGSVKLIVNATTGEIVLSNSGACPDSVSVSGMSGVT